MKSSSQIFGKSSQNLGFRPTWTVTGDTPRRDCRQPGTDFYRVACEQEFAGIVAKLKTGPSTPEATAWVKIKNANYSQAEG